jgi:tetratricopeptide (TPR) repeat protein
MRLSAAIAIAFLCLAPVSSYADAPPAPAADEPWVGDTALLKQCWADVQASGLRALEPRVPALEAAVARGRDAMDLARHAPGTHILLTDGPAETLAALMTAATDDKDHTKSIAIENPYPQLALLLGSYYNEVQRPADAVRVLDIGLGFSFLPDANVGVHMPDLEGERGVGFVGLKRWADALGAYDAALTAPNLSPAMEAHLERGRGFALTELGRLDDAEAAYLKSLRLEPGNKRALGELDYIAGLKAGKVPAPTEVINVGSPAGPNSAVPLDPKNREKGSAGSSEDNSQAGGASK